MPTINDLAEAPTWTPHRSGIAAQDASNSTNKADGVQTGEHFQEVAVDVALVSGSATDIDVDVLFWSESASAFVVQPNPSLAVNNQTTSFQLSFRPVGRIFWVKVVALTGTAPVLDIMVTGLLNT